MTARYITRMCIAAVGVHQNWAHFTSGGIRLCEESRYSEDCQLDNRRFGVLTFLHVSIVRTSKECGTTLLLSSVCSSDVAL